MYSNNRKSIKKITKPNMATEEIIIEDNQLVCVLTDKPKKATS